MPTQKSNACSRPCTMHTDHKTNRITGYTKTGMKCLHYGEQNPRSMDSTEISAGDGLVTFVADQHKYLSTKTAWSQNDLFSASSCSKQYTAIKFGYETLNRKLTRTNIIFFTHETRCAVTIFFFRFAYLRQRFFGCKFSSRFTKWKCKIYRLFAVICEKFFNFNGLDFCFSFVSVFLSSIYGLGM